MLVLHVARRGCCHPRERRCPNDDAAARAHQNARQPQTVYANYKYSGLAARECVPPGLGALETCQRRGGGGVSLRTSSRPCIGTASASARPGGPQQERDQLTEYPAYMRRWRARRAVGGDRVRGSRRGSAWFTRTARGTWAQQEANVVWRRLAESSCNGCLYWQRHAVVSLAQPADDLSR